MKPEYQKVYETLTGPNNIYIGNSENDRIRFAVLEAVGRCEALADESEAKPVRELTDEEYARIWSDSWKAEGVRETIKFIINSVRAKRSEPNEIPFDQAKLDEGGWSVKIIFDDGESDRFETVAKVTLARKP